jgi:hypothetical protein
LILWTTLHLIGITQFLAAFFKAKYSSLNATSSFGNDARILMIFRKLMFNDSNAFVVGDDLVIEAVEAGLMLLDDLERSWSCGLAAHLSASVLACLVWSYEELLRELPELSPCEERLS